MVHCTRMDKQHALLHGSWVCCRWHATAVAALHCALAVQIVALGYHQAAVMDVVAALLAEHAYLLRGHFQPMHHAPAHVYGQNTFHKSMLVPTLPQTLMPQVPCWMLMKRIALPS